MREILFRGKRKDNGEWVEGFYFERKDTQCQIIEAIIIEDAYEQVTGGQRYIRSDLNHDCYRVDPVTVGQYTGLQDKNGQRIFEGDIVADGNEIFVCFWDGCNVEFGVKNKDLSFGIAYLPITEYEVIGNIHDNPELLEVQNDG